VIIRSPAAVQLGVEGDDIQALFREGVMTVHPGLLSSDATYPGKRFSDTETGGVNSKPAPSEARCSRLVFSEDWDKEHLANREARH
jgi:hypothetical protein